MEETQIVIAPLLFDCNRHIVYRPDGTEVVFRISKGMVCQLTKDIELTPAEMQHIRKTLL